MHTTHGTMLLGPCHASAATHGCAWMRMDAHGCAWMRMDAHGHMTAHGCAQAIWVAARLLVLRVSVCGRSGGER
eukprot:5287167-Prymnesium_polylepis.1